MLNQLTHQIGILINPEDPLLLEYLRGIRDFTSHHPEWDLYGIGLPCYQEVTSVSEWNGDACIVSSDLDTYASAIMRSRSKCGIVIGESKEANLPSIELDLESWLNHAIDHFVGQGLRNIALYCKNESPWLPELTKISQAHRITFSVCREDDLETLLSRQNTPTGILTYDCASAIEVSAAAQRLSLCVPQDVAILTLGDSLNCQLSSPGISSLEYPARSLAFEAASKLHALLNGGKISARTLLPTGEVRVRASSQRETIEDSLVNQAMKEIYRTVDHAPLRVGELAKNLGVSRANLTERFQRFVGVPPADFIRQKRLDAAMRLLKQPGEMIKSVAISLGFSSSQEFARFFKNTAGITPTEYARSESNTTK